MDFSNRYLTPKSPANWHHELFYDILQNRVIQKEDGKLYFNTYFNKEGQQLPFKLPDPSSIPAKINQNILVEAPRFHSKSQCFTIDYPLWEIYRNPNIRIMIVSANEAIAVSFNRAILNHLENNHALIDELGYLVPQYQDRLKWGEKALLVKRDSMEKDPTVAAIGVGGRLISRRADIIIIDDLIDIESARTKSARKRTLEWYENVLVPILEDGGRLIIVGTAWYKDDIYDTLMKESGFDIRLKLKALMYDERYRRTGNTRYIPYKLLEYPQAQKAQDIFSDELIKHYKLGVNLRGGVLWQNKWSFQKLIDKKEKTKMSNASFSRQYLNEPISEQDQLFKEKHIKEALERGSDKRLVPSWDNSNPNKDLDYGHLTIAIGVDLAISKRARSDNSSIAVWGLDEKRNRIPLYLDYGKWSPDETKTKIIEAYHNFRPVKIRVENIAFQDMLRQELAAENIPVEGFHTTSTKKFNEETGLAHIAMLLEQGKIILPSSQTNKDYYDRVRQLISELLEYSYSDHAGDLLMGSWFAIDVLKDFDNKLRENRGYFSTTALVEQNRNVRAAHRIFILGYKPPVFKISYSSLLYIFRPVEKDMPFVELGEPFMIFATKHDRCIAYILHKQTNEVVGKIDGDISPLLFASLLEKAGNFFNDAQIVIDKNGEGEAVLLELMKRDYRNLLVYQPDENNNPVYQEGFKITEKFLPLAVEYFKNMVDGLHITIPDEQLVSEMGELIAVEGDKLTMGFGEGQRIKTISSALWLLDNYENMEKLELSKKPKRKKSFQPRYRVFQKSI